MSATVRDRIYSNAGNAPVVDLIGQEHTVILDVGCGAGDNAALLRARQPEKRIYGITASSGEAQRASAFMQACVVCNVETELPSSISERSYDAIVLCHVLEHLRNPADVVARLAKLLRVGGECVIAVPNVLNWRDRAHFLVGRFEYEEAGVMDETHLRFFTYHTASRYLLAKAPELRVVEQKATGAVPLWLLRRHVLPRRVAAAIDELGCALVPNLFGSQILIKAVKNRASPP